MRYVVVRQDKIVNRWDIAETDKVSAASNFLLFMPEEDWLKLTDGNEEEYIKLRGWTNGTD